MRELHRDFKGVFIPKALWMDTNLSMNEKALLVEIDQLSSDDSACWAGNAHFANFLNLSKSRVTDIISSLVDRGYLTSWIETENGIFKNRWLSLTPIGKQGYPPHRDSDPTPSENGEVSNTNSSNTKIKSIPPISPPLKALAAANRQAIGEETYSEDFLMFWGIWPKGKGGSKAAAYKAWLKLGLDNRQRAGRDGQIVRLHDDVIQRGMHHRQWLDGYVPHMATYLNQRQWTADIDTSTGTRTNGRAKTTYDRIMEASERNRAALREDIDDIRSRQFDQ